MTVIREKGHIGIWRINEGSNNEAIGVYPSFQMESDHAVYRNLIIERKNVRSPDR